MRLADPWVLAAAAPLLAAWSLLWWRRRGGEAVPLPDAGRLADLPRGWRARLAPAVGGLRIAAVVLLLLALARPQAVRPAAEVRSEGIDIVLVIDTSDSMRALDLEEGEPRGRRRDRLEVARDVVRDFVAGRSGDQIGLVVFGERAYTRCPLTLDHGVLTRLIEGLRIGAAGNATAVGDALGLAVKRLRGSEAESRVAVLLTDGRSNAGAIDPLQAAEIAAVHGVRVYTVGVGGRSAGRLRELGVDEATLRRIAEISGGAYFHAADARTLAAIYAEIDRLETREIVRPGGVEHADRYPWLVAPALALVLLESGLLATLLRRLP